MYHCKCKLYEFIKIVGIGIINTYYYNKIYYGNILSIPTKYIKLFNKYILYDV